MRVLTYNIRGGLGMDGVRDTARIAQVVIDSAPEIVCFQEVHQCLPWSGWTNQPALLARHLGMHFVFQKTINTLVGGYGLGIATSGEIISVLRHRLPGTGERRGALELTCQTKGQTLTVFCTHWGLKDAERIEQARFLAKRVGEASTPVIVCGDFNEGSEGLAVAELLRLTGLRDAGDAGNAPTYPADNPRARIDYILHSPSLAVVTLNVLETEASDHRPVLARL